MRDADRRYLCRLIDLAVDDCEQRNLRESRAVPRWVADLVVHLQAVAGDERLSPPRDPITAHGQLLDLRAAYMPPLPPELRYEPQEEAPARPKGGAAR